MKTIEKESYKKRIKRNKGKEKEGREAKKGKKGREEKEGKPQKKKKAAWWLAFTLHTPTPSTFQHSQQMAQSTNEKKEVETIGGTD